MTPPAYTSLSNETQMGQQQQQQQHQQHQVVAVQHGNVPVVSGNQTRPGNWKSMTGTGITQIVLGSLTVILGIVGCVIWSFFSFIGYPFWCGLGFYCVAGILGVVAGNKQNPCVAIAYMIMSIFACLASFTVLGLSATAIVCDHYSYCYYRDYMNTSWRGRVAVDAILLILALVEFVVSIVGASMTCSAICSSAPTSTVIHYQSQPQFVVATQPQGTYYPPQGQQQFAYPPQQVGAPQGLYIQGQAPPQATPQAAPQATPQAPPAEHQYQ